ncbi:MAG: hypothetical protein ACOCZJ_00700 [Thermoplasmatota archaeon]
MEDSEDEMEEKSQTLSPSKLKDIYENEEVSSAEKEVDRLLLNSLKQILDFDNVTYVALIKKEGKLMGELKEDGSDEPDFYYSSLAASYTATMGAQSGRRAQYISIAMPDCFYLMREMNDEYIFALRLDNYDNFTDIIKKIDEESEFLDDKWTRTQIITKLRRKYNIS